MGADQQHASQWCPTSTIVCENPRIVNQSGHLNIDQMPWPPRYCSHAEPSLDRVQRARVPRNRRESNQGEWFQVVPGGS
jgi:hypothetical protein